MAVIATLLSAEVSGLGWKVQIEYADGADIRVISERFNGTTISELKDFARIKALKVDDIIASFDFTTVIGQSIDVTPEITPDPEPPTAAEVAKAAWFAKWYQLQRVQIVLKSIPALATAQNLAFESSLQTTLEADWLDSYLGDI